MMLLSVSFAQLGINMAILMVVQLHAIFFYD